MFQALVPTTFLQKQVIIKLNKFQLIESPGKSIGQKTAVKSLAGELGPGPGGYSADKQKKGDFKFSMGGKIKNIAFDKQSYKPGPGNYSAEKPHNVPTMKFGTG